MILQELQNFLQQYKIGLRDIFDILLAAFLIYQSYRIFTRTRAIPVIFGLFFIFAMALISRWLQLETLTWFFETVSTYVIFAVIVVLQPELRRIFYRFGEGKFFRNFFKNMSVIPVEEIAQALVQMAEEKTGAIVIILGKVGLRHLSEGGIPLAAKLSKELLMSIFYGKNPLHDGAVIIEGNMILSAATYLPISHSSMQIKRSHGARHRAGLGVSEESDALVLIVSEEKGKISAAHSGELLENLDSTALKSLLTAYNNGQLETEWEARALLATPQKKNLKKKSEAKTS